MTSPQPGFYGDLLYRGGELVVVRSLVWSVTCPDWTADVTAHEYLMFLNAVLDPATQQIYASGKAHIGSRVVIVGPDTFETIIPCGSGNYPSQLAVVDGRVVCYVVLSGTEYGMFDLAGALLETRPIPVEHQGTSQGIRFVADDGTIVWGDDTLGGIFEGLLLHEWMQRGGYTGGQGHDGGFGLSGNGVSTVYPSGNTLFPRIAVAGPQLALLYVNGPSVFWDTLTLPLEAIPPAPPLTAPTIAVLHYDPILKAGEPWTLQMHVGDTKVDVEIDSSQQLWIDAENAAGEDHTGSVRQLTIEGPDPEPEPEPEPPPMLRRYWLQPNIGSKDLLDLFDDPSHLMGLDVIVIYAQHVLTDVATPQLGPNTWPNFVAHGSVQTLKDAARPLVIEMGSVKDGDCQALANIAGMQEILQRVHDAGGQVAAFSADEPITNSRACHQSLAQTAEGHATWTHAVRALGPIEVGWLEAWPAASLDEQRLFLQELKGLDALPDYWHLDIDWNRAQHEHKNPVAFIDAAKVLAAQYEITLGIFVNSTVDPIPTDLQHHQNLIALAQKIYGLVPDIAHVSVAAWAHRVSPDPMHATQNVPNNLGAAGLLQTFTDVAALFAGTPPPTEEIDPMLYKLMDPTTAGIIRLKQLKPLDSAPGKVTAILPNGHVVSILPDGSFAERDPAALGPNEQADGPYEQCYADNGLLFYEPASEKRYAWAYRLLPA
jgi:hypothetical protein